MKKYTIISVCISFIILLAGCTTVLPNAEEDTGNGEQSAKTKNIKVEVNLNEKEQAVLNPYDFPVGEQPYFIYCEKESHTLTIFKKNEAGYYAEIVGQYLTGTGKGMSMTPTGIFKIEEKQEWYRWPSGNYSPYVSKFYPNRSYGGLFIHSPVYYGKRFRSPYMPSIYSIGRNSTSGCLRTSVEASYFIYKNCEIGTMIKIVNGSPFATSAPPVKVNLQFSDPAANPGAFEYFSGKSSIEFKDENIYVNEGETVSLIPETIDNYNQSNYRWTSSKTDVAEVHNGFIEAKSPGTTRITALSLSTGISDSITIKVKVDEKNKKEEAVSKPNNKPVFNELENKVHLTANDMRMIYKETEFTVDQRMNDIFSVFGYNFNFTQAPSCAYKGYDKFYSYTYKDETGVDFSTVPISGADTICEVYATSPEVSTAKGIKAGSTESELKEAYGTDCTVEFASEYGADDGYYVVTYWLGEKNNPLTPRMFFLLDSDNHKVTAIAMSSAKKYGIGDGLVNGIQF